MFYVIVDKTMKVGNFANITLVYNYVKSLRKEGHEAEIFGVVDPV